MRKVTPQPSTEHAVLREIAKTSPYVQDLLLRMSEVERINKNLSDPGHVKDLRRIGDALCDERLRVIANQLEAGGRYVPPPYLEKRGWETVASTLEDDRSRMSKGLRALEKRKFEGKDVEWWEQREAQRMKSHDEHRLKLDAKLLAGVGFPTEDDIREGVKVAELGPNGANYCLKVNLTLSSVPFPTLEAGRRRACLEVLGGELKVRLILLKFLNLNGVDHGYLSWALGTAQQDEEQLRTDRDDLWALLQGVRQLAVTARGLGAPPDVLVTLDAWHIRVRSLAYNQNPHLSQVSSEIRRISRERRLPSENAPPDTRLRNLRCRLEGQLLRRQFSPEELAILEIAWLPFDAWRKSSKKDRDDDSDEALDPDMLLAEGERPDVTVKDLLQTRVRALKRLIQKPKKPKSRVL